MKHVMLRLDDYFNTPPEHEYLTPDGEDIIGWVAGRLSIPLEDNMDYEGPCLMFLHDATTVGQLEQMLQHRPDLSVVFIEM